MVEVSSNWRDSYKRRASYVSAAIAIENQRAKAGSVDESKSTELANAAFRSALKLSPTVLESSNGDSELDERIEKGGFDGFLASGQKVLETPVAQGVLDALSVGTYTTANIADDIIDGAEKVSRGDIGGLGDIAASPISGTVKGVKAAFGSDEDTKTWGEIIKRGQEAGGFDTENDAAKWVQGIGGFAGDVLLDPTTYMTFGGSAAIKGAATGFREGAKASKEVAGKALADAERAGASLKGTEDGTKLSRIAENPKGRIGTAIDGAMSERARWKAKRKQDKLDRKSIRQSRANATGELDAENAIIGSSPKAQQERMDARQAERDNLAQAKANAETERKARLAEEAYEAATKAGPDLIREAADDVATEPIPTNPAVTPEDVVKMEEDIPKPELNDSKGAEAELAEVSSKLADEPTPAEKIMRDINGKVIDKFEPLWVKNKYRDKKLVDALSQPSTIQVPMKVPNWNEVLKDLKANPKQVIQYGVGDDARVTTAAKIIANVEAQGGDPSKLLPHLNLPAELTEKHASEFTRVKKPKQVEEIRTADYVGLAAEGKQKKKEQKIRGKSSKKVADEKDFGPQQEEFAVSAHKDGTTELDESVIFTKASHLTDEAEEAGFMEEAFHEYVLENPDEILKVQDKTSGVETQITLEKFADLLEGYNSSGANETIINKYLKSNVLFFSKFDAEVDEEQLAEELANWQKAVDEWQASKAPEEVADDVAEEVGEADIPSNDIFDDSDEWELQPNYGDAPNPKAWSPDKASLFKIAEEDAHLSPQEILSIQTKMDNRDIKSWITAKEGGISKAELDELRQFTGKTDAKEVADEFIKLRKLYQQAVSKAESEAKAKKPTRVDEVKKVMDEAEISAIAQESAKMADEILDSPVALNEVAQREFRVADYERALKAPIDEGLSGTLSRDHANDAARQAVKASIEFQTKEGLEKTNQGFETMTKNIEDGGAWRPDRWGSSSQIALHKSVFDYVKNLDYTGKWKPTAMRKAYMTIMEVADKELRAMGVEPFLNHVNHLVGKKGIQHAANLSAYDILKSMESAGFKKELETIISGGWTRGYQITPIQGAAETIIRMRAGGYKEDEVYRRAMRQLLAGKDETFEFGRPKDNGAAAEKFRDNQMKAMRNKSGSTMSAVRTKAGDAKKIVNALMAPETFRAMNVQMMVNHAAHASALGKNVDDLVAETVKTLKGLANAGDSGDVLGYLRGQMKDISSRFSPEDIANAKGLFHARMAEHMSEAEKIVFEQSTKRAEAFKPKPAVVKENIERNAEIIDSGKNAGKPAHELFVHDQPAPNPNQAKINKSHVVEARAAVTEVMEKIPAEGAEDFEIIGASIAAAAMKKIHPMQKYVNPRLGLTDNVYRQINSGLHSVARQQAEFHGSLLTHLAKYGDEALLTDFRELQRLAKESGPHDENNPFMLPLDASDSMRELYGITTTMFSKSAYNVFVRNGVGANHFNTLARAAGIPDKWRFRPDGDRYSNSTLWAEWQGIEEKGVLDFLSRMHSVAVKASQDIAIAASFSDNFGKSAPGPGLVKINWTNRTKVQKETSIFYDLIDKELYYPKEIAAQVTQIDKLLTESRHIDPKGPLGKFIVNVFDPVTNAIKASQTTVRPGHWTISIAGDLLRNQLAGVNSVVPYKHAAKIMIAGKKLANGEEDEFFGKIASLKAIRNYGQSQEINQGFVGTSKGAGVTLFVGGKKVNVDYETMNKLLRDVVMLPKHRGGGVMEDRFIENNPTGKLARGLEKATDFVTDNQAAGGKFSLNEWASRRDNLMRLSLAVDYASKRKWKNLQEMKDGMEEYVTKWAPTSTDFTSFEAKYARRSLLYYTWLRGITPRILDSAFTKPGVTTIVPKALYNMAYANGLNPESIGNPFPEDGMFPSYYKNNILGPQWQDDFGMWGINPSSPVIEVGNTFSKFSLSDPLGNAEGALSQLGGMATPFVKMPAELATGTQAGTGVPIEDKWQYAGDNLGGSWLSSLSRATGKTLTPDGIVDRTDSAAKLTGEDQGEHAKLQLMNFLSGLKLTDYQSLASQKAAAYDLAEEERRKAELLERQR
jgi:hypothetical protein